MAKSLNLSASDFSFNSTGGRCETCKGLGTITEDLSFLGEVDVICPQCEGQKFSAQVLSVTYNNKNIIDLLNLTVDDAAKLFHDQMKIYHPLSLVSELGLGYLTLGQATNSFSGGEAQRLKLVKKIIKTDHKNHSLLFIDEPSVGLADSDIAQLLKILRRLIKDGNTIIIIEHHLGVIKSSNWLLELGPKASSEGGKLLYCGPSQGILKCPESITKQYLL